MGKVQLPYVEPMCSSNVGRQDEIYLLKVYDQITRARTLRIFKAV
jgi:NRPS condensation-like uncharacterized protein